MSRDCYICGAIIQERITWTFWQVMKQYCCLTCLNSFSPIQSPYCDCCGKSIEKAELICRDCTAWKEKGHNYLLKNRSLYKYNDFAKEVLAKFKYRGDYEIARIFSKQLQDVWKQMGHDNFEMVPIPLHSNRLKERGFNQTEALLNVIPKSYQTILKRKQGEKQSKKSREERLKTKQIFYLANEIDLRGKQIVLIDDIYTTGTTLRLAAQVLHEHGAKRVESVTIFR